jgi:hypothetical protein
MQASIEQSQQNMTLALSNMLQGVGFAPGLQSPFSQGQYLLPLDASPHHIFIKL